MYLLDLRSIRPSTKCTQVSERIAEISLVFMIGDEASKTVNFVTGRWTGSCPSVVRHTARPRRQVVFCKIRRVRL